MTNKTLVESRSQETQNQHNSQPTTQPTYKRRFDEQTWNKLDGHDFRILDHLMFLSKIQSRNNGGGAAYAQPSEQWLAKKLGIRREAISRHVVKLHNLGVLERTRRRKVRGRWQTNLYKVVRWVWWRLKAALGPHRATPSPCAPKRTHSKTYVFNKEPSRAKGEPTAISGLLTDLFQKAKQGKRLDFG